MQDPYRADPPCFLREENKIDKIGAGYVRDCPQTKASSIFGIILAAFRFLFWGHIFFHDIAPKKGIENRLKRTRKSTEAWFVDSLLESGCSHHLFAYLPSSIRKAQ